MDLPAYAMFGASAADLITTEMALDRGCIEVNPLFRNRNVRITAKVVAPILIQVLTERLEKRGHRRWAKGLRWGVAGAWSAAAAWNIYQMKKQEDAWRTSLVR